MFFRFDGQFILGWLLAQGNTPEVIPCASKIMCITQKSLNLKIIDSLNFLPMALSKLPGCFGLNEIKKRGIFLTYLILDRTNRTLDLYLKSNITVQIQ